MNFDLHLNSGADYLVEVCETLSKKSNDLELQANTQEFIAYSQFPSKQVLYAKEAMNKYLLNKLKQILRGQ